MTEFSEHIYARPMTQHGKIDLALDFYPVPGAEGPVPLLIWLHSGGFKHGTRKHGSHRRIARHITKAGYAVAVLDYRLSRDAPRLLPQTLALKDRLDADAARNHTLLRPNLRDHRALAAMEDLCFFFRWIERKKQRLGLDGTYLLCGSSAGAITVLNTLFLAPHIGRALPPIRSALCLSGGFAFPGYLHPIQTRIMAIHNPADERVAFEAMRAVETVLPRQTQLLVAQEQAHGSPMLTENDRLGVALHRFLSFDQAARDGRPMPALPALLAAEAQEAPSAAA